MSVPRGEIFGFLGPNGAGKSTTLRVMLDLLRPTSGSVRIFGMDCNDGSSAVRGRVGYLPGDLTVYPNMTVRASINLFSALRPGRVSDAYVNELCDRLSLDINLRNRELSQGNKQKVGVVLAVMAKAELIILDEPTNALDPLVQREVLHILGEARDKGSTVFFSSHNLTEVERICDRVGMIRNGKLIGVKRIEDIVSQRLTVLKLRFAQAPPPDAFLGLNGVKVTSTNDEGREIYLEASGEVDAVIKSVAQHHVLKIEVGQPSLEEEFLALYEHGMSSPEAVRAPDAGGVGENSNG
jgi:ABC-2 type transport system ATP-binding protein